VGAGERRRPWLKDVGPRCSGLLTAAAGGPPPSGVTNCAGPRAGPPAPGVHPIKCHVLAALPPSSKNCFKVLWRKKCHPRLEMIQSGGRTPSNPPPLLRPAPQAIVRSTFCGGADSPINMDICPQPPHLACSLWLHNSQRQASHTTGINNSADGLCLCHTKLLILSMEGASEVGGFRCRGRGALAARSPPGC